VSRAWIHKALRSKSLGIILSGVVMGMMTLSPIVWASPVQNGAPIPALALDHETPIMLSDGRQGWEIFQWHASQWRVQWAIPLPRDAMVVAQTLVCSSHGECLAAGVVFEGKREPWTPQVWVFRQRRWGAPWTRVFRRTILDSVAGTIDVALKGSDMWVLAQGTPGLGSMAKQLWASQNDGTSWSQIASGGLASPKDPTDLRILTGIPTGYPTGLTAIPTGHLILTNSPRGNSTTLAIEYGTGTQSAVPLLRSVSTESQSIVAAYPAILHAGVMELPLVEFQRGQAILALAFRRNGERRWTIQSLGLGPSGLEIVAASGTADVLAGSRTVYLILANHAIHSWPLRPMFVHPLVATLTPQAKIVVLGRNRTLWINTTQGWRPWNGTVPQNSIKKKLTPRWFALMFRWLHSLRL